MVLQAVAMSKGGGAPGRSRANDPDTRALIRLLDAAGSGNDPDAELARLLPILDFENPTEVVAILRQLATNADTNKS